MQLLEEVCLSDDWSGIRLLKQPGYLLICALKEHSFEVGQVFYLHVPCIRVFTGPQQDGLTGVGAMTKDRELYVEAARTKAGRA